MRGCSRISLMLLTKENGRRTKGSSILKCVGNQERGISEPWLVNARHGTQSLVTEIIRVMISTISFCLSVGRPESILARERMCGEPNTKVVTESNAASGSEECKGATEMCFFTGAALGTRAPSALEDRKVANLFGFFTREDTGTRAASGPEG